MAGADFELVMPFVVVASRGGPYEDEAYVAGWEMGELRHDVGSLARSPGDWMLVRTVRTLNVPQVDMIAAEVRAVCEVSHYDGGEWSGVTIRRGVERDHG